MKIVCMWLALSLICLKAKSQDPTLGTCCTAGICTQASKSDCETKLNGKWLGTNTSCSPNPCEGACCIYGTNREFLGCAISIQANCQNSDGSATWYSSACNFTQCPATAPTNTPANFILIPNEKFNASFIESEGKVQVNWEHPFPAEPTSFYIARSGNARDFRLIGLLDAQLQFTDNYPLAEGYYRIYYKRNGQDYASQTLAVFAMKTGKMQLLPNPSTGKLRLLLSKMESFDTDVTIHDATGKMVYRKQLMKGQRPELDISILPAGTFIVRATQNGVTYVEKLLKH